LRRECSPDYSDADIGDPVLEVILQPGVSAVLQGVLLEQGRCPTLMVKGMFRGK
jgi:hypothetical protein